MPSTTFLHLVGMRPGQIVGGDLMAFLDQMETLYTLARKYNERELADKIRQTATGWGTGASKETMKKALDTIHAEVASVLTATAGGKKQGFRKVIEGFIQSAGGDPGVFLQPPAITTGTSPTSGQVNITGGSASPMTTWDVGPSSLELREIEKLKQAWAEHLRGEMKVVQESLPAVFMRECPCCGSPVWFDREKDAVTSEKPNVG